MPATFIEALYRSTRLLRVGICAENDDDIVPLATNMGDVVISRVAEANAKFALRLSKIVTSGKKRHIWKFTVRGRMCGAPRPYKSNGKGKAKRRRRADEEQMPP